MQKTKALFGVFAVTAGLIMQSHICRGAAWEGTDDFSGTLAKWDTTYIHYSQPSDGFFLSGGHLQFIKTVTTTGYESSGLLIWPKSLPLNTNWTVLVDAHLKPLSVKSSNPIDQDIRSAVYVFESISTAFSPIKRRLGTELGNGANGDVIQMPGPDIPLSGGGWDFTLGMGFDASTKTGTSFYYPINQQSQLVILTSLNMSTFTNMQIMLYGLSEYWAVGSGEHWLDNFRVSGTANASPNVALVKAVIPSFNALILGRGYQLQVSSDLTNWLSQGSPFVATNFNMICPEYWAVDNWNKLFFRLQLAP